MTKKLTVTSAKHERKMAEMRRALQGLRNRLAVRDCTSQAHSERTGIVTGDLKQDPVTQTAVARKHEAEVKAATEEMLEFEETIVGPLRDFLGGVNGKAHMHTLGASEVIELAEEAERVLKSKGVLVKNRTGAEFEFRPEGKIANATYARKAGPQITTFVKMVRVTDGWRLVEARRENAWCNQKAHWRLVVSEAARDDLIAKAMDSISVRSDTAA